MCKLPNSVSVHRLGEHGENRRIWIVNKKVQETFGIGEKVNVVYDKDAQTVTIGKAETFGGNHTVSSRNGKTPIIDIKNRRVQETFGEGVEKVEVLFYHDQIVIKVSHTEQAKIERAKKTGLNTFELFAGAGTLTHFFKKAGFNVVGGLELNDEYLAMFHENNPGEEIYSISGRLEDVDPALFPKDIDVLLSGIPCTHYSGSNVRLKAAQKAKREGRPYDESEIEKEYTAEALTFYVLMAIFTMNPKTVVVEEVVEYSESPASQLLRTVLAQRGFSISEAVSSGFHTKRQRWVLVANQGAKVNLSNLIHDDGKTIGDFLEASVEERDWKPKEDFPPSRLNESIGIRFCVPSDTMSNTFTTHGTRGTEPILKHPYKDLYSEFTNREIANIHGIDPAFVIDERKGIGRQIIGQGVTDMFYVVAQRILEAYQTKGGENTMIAKPKPSLLDFLIDDVA